LLRRSLPIGETQVSPDGLSVDNPCIPGHPFLHQRKTHKNFKSKTANLLVCRSLISYQKIVLVNLVLRRSFIITENSFFSKEIPYMKTPF